MVHSAYGLCHLAAASLSMISYRNYICNLLWSFVAPNHIIAVLGCQASRRKKPKAVKEDFTETLQKGVSLFTVRAIQSDLSGKRGKCRVVHFPNTAERGRKKLGNFMICGLYAKKRIELLSSLCYKIHIKRRNKQTKGRSARTNVPAAAGFQENGRMQD